MMMPGAKHGSVAPGMHAMPTRRGAPAQPVKAKPPIIRKGAALQRAALRVKALQGKE
jgi:hypothetical protein